MWTAYGPIKVAQFGEISRWKVSAVTNRSHLFDMEHRSRVEGSEFWALDGFRVFR